MTATLESSYQPLQPFGSDAGDSDDTPQESGLVYHIAPEPGKARWNHVEDLDSFFTRIYIYHQQGGFKAIVIDLALDVLSFLFFIIFCTYFSQCVEYGVYFRTRPPRGHTDFQEKISLGDGVVPFGECVSGFNWIILILLALATCCLLFKVSKAVLNILQFSDIKQFYNIALKIQDSDLDNYTWHDVQKRVREVQREQQMCIHKQELTELDIYHRILRFKNYMVALVSKDLIPLYYNNRFQEGYYLSKGLRFNIGFLFFYGPWAPFESSWHLRDEYKKTHKRLELAKFLSRMMIIVGIVNFLFSFLFMLFHVVYEVLSLVEMFKREPGALGSRRWTHYSRLYFRHYNELDHELNARLNRAYRAAVKYTQSFHSRLTTIIASKVVFVCGSVLGVFLIIGLIDEDFFHVEHVLTIVTALGVTVASARAMTPDENLVYCPETLLNAVLSQVHYLPSRWKGLAHTSTVNREFMKYFNYRILSILFEIISPFMTPYILIFVMRHRALEYVDFFRNFTVDVVGVGDVCSFALMDVGRHEISPNKVNPQPSAQNQQTQVTIGADQNAAQAVQSQLHVQEIDQNKIELSLIHFTLTNPEWKPPKNANSWVTAYRSQMNSLNPAQYDHLRFQLNSIMHGSSFMGTNPLTSFQIRNLPHDILADSVAPEPPHVLTGLRRTEGPSEIVLPTSNENQENVARISTFDRNIESSIVDEMNLSTLYYYERQHRENRATPDIWSQPLAQPAFERTPLLSRPHIGH